jgi:hypothetical protein
VTADNGHTLGGLQGGSLAHVSAETSVASSLVEKFPPTLPKSLSYLRLVNLEFRGKALDVVISRLPSGRVVRRVTFNAAGQMQ